MPKKHRELKNHIKKETRLNLTLCLLGKGKALNGYRLQSTKKFLSARKSMANKNAFIYLFFFPNHKIYIKGDCLGLSYASQKHKRTFSSQL